MAKKRTGYTWVLNPMEMLCVKNGDDQTLRPKLWEAEEATEAHDQVLIGVTKAINGILEDVSKKSPRRNWELSIISFQDRYMLAWTRPIRDALRPGDDPLEIAELLRLRRDDPDYPLSE